MSKTSPVANLIAALDALDRIRMAILEVIAEAGPDGAPANMIHLALQQHGATIDHYNTFMQAFVSRGALTQDAGRYYITVSGLQQIAQLKQFFARKPREE